MTDSRAATGLDRLPWLTDDEPTPARAVRIDPLIGDSFVVIEVDNRGGEVAAQ